MFNVRSKRRQLFQFLQSHGNLILLILVSVVFSSALMFSTFSYRDHTIVLGSKIWSDFWANIPLIRSFSMGNNIPPEYPLFPGERIRYHFLFFFLVGMLEKIGLRIDIALNILSIFGFSGMMIGLYFFTKHLSKSKLAGWLAIFLLIFNSSLSWMYYLNKGVDTPIEIVTNQDFATAGPYDNTVISSYWKLNIYTNQRHMTIAFTLLAISIWAIVYAKDKRWTAVGILMLITLSWLHKAVLLMAFITLGALLITQQRKRLRIGLAVIISVLLSLPGILYLNGDGITTEKAITWQPGFLYQSTDWHEFGFHLNGFTKWLAYWFFNIGILPFIAFGGWLVIVWQKLSIKKNWQKVTTFLSSDVIEWFGVGIAIFVIANLFRFAKDLGTNHKFINFTILIFCGYAANLLVFLWKKTRLGIVVPLLILLLTLGGVFDFFPVFNDRKVTWDDVAKDTTAKWIADNTPPQSVFLNTSYSYNPIVITGRKIFWGWDYFTSSIGYPLNERKRQLAPVLQGKASLTEACQFLEDNHIQYIFVSKYASDEAFAGTIVNLNYFEEIFGSGKIDFADAIIYDSAVSCHNDNS